MSTRSTVAGAWHEMWTTPILLRRVLTEPGYNEALRDLILDRQSSAIGDKAGVIDAVKTRSDLLRWDHPLVDPLRGWIAEVASTLNAEVSAGANPRGEDVPMVAEAWAVVYHEWGYHQIHAHHDAAWSGVYYVHTGDMAEGSGLIQWLDPRPAACAREYDRCPLQSLAPEPGMLVGFPAWLQHWVTPYDGDSERVVVAFNVGFER